jgi:hypothetical protein
MDLLSKLFGRGKFEPKKDAEHALIVYFRYGQSSLDPLHALEEKLRIAISQADVGEYDGHEIAMDLRDGSLYMYGIDAYNLYSVVEPILETSSFMMGATARLCFGPPAEGVCEELIVIKSPSTS